jgi:hypothetical protein
MFSPLSLHSVFCFLSLACRLQEMTSTKKVFGTYIYIVTWSLKMQHSSRTKMISHFYGIMWIGFNVTGIYLCICLNTKHHHCDTPSTKCVWWMQRNTYHVWKYLIRCAVESLSQRRDWSYSAIISSIKSPFFLSSSPSQSQVRVQKFYHYFRHSYIATTFMLIL